VPDLSFQVERAEALAFAVTPMLALKLRISNAVAEEQIHSILLRCQIQIEATRRRYSAQEQEGLYDLFGQPQEWGRTLHGILWTHSNVSVPGFCGSTVVDVPVPCTYDFNVAATKYFDALEQGEVPLCLLFSGTVFYASAAAPLQVAQIPWENEALFRLPVAVWREMMDRYYPNGAWLSLRKDIFDRLSEYKSRLGLPTWDQALDSLLRAASEEVVP
jgi:hypothetical protein